MDEMEYVSEDVLQELIADYPHLLAGYEMDMDEPRKWLLVGREQILPHDSTGMKLFYLDHLFLDQDGVPTIVETKRSCDNRLRREVVAQMLDYASNALLYLPVEGIISNLTKNYPGIELDELIKINWVWKWILKNSSSLLKPIFRQVKSGWYLLLMNYQLNS